MKDEEHAIIGRETVDLEEFFKLFGEIIILSSFLKSEVLVTNYRRPDERLGKKNLKDS